MLGPPRARAQVHVCRPRACRPRRAGTACVSHLALLAQTPTLASIDRRGRHSARPRRQL